MAASYSASTRTNGVLRTSRPTANKGCSLLSTTLSTAPNHSYPMRFLLSECRPFRDRTGTTCQRERNENERDLEVLRRLVWAMENPGKVRILRPWWKKALFFWKKWATVGIEQGRWSKCERATSLANSDALRRPHRSVFPLGGKLPRCEGCIKANPAWGDGCLPGRSNGVCPFDEPQCRAVI